MPSPFQEKTETHTRVFSEAVKKTSKKITLQGAYVPSTIKLNGNIGERRKRKRLWSEQFQSKYFLKMQQPTIQIATPWTMLMTGIIIISFSNDIRIIFVHHFSQRIYKSHNHIRIISKLFASFNEYYYPNFHKFYDYFFVCFLKFPIF